MKYIFVDLDETLFHSSFLSGNRNVARGRLTPGQKLIELEDEYYGSTLRDGALDLLAKLRAVPNSQVLVLTSSVTDYANANNVVHGLGFTPDQIFARAQLQSRDISGVTIADPKAADLILVDNLPRQENRIKIWWLNALTSNPVRYIRVPEFLAHADDRPFDDSLISSIVTQIVDTPSSR